MKIRERIITKLVLDALQTDGGHHKQWYLERILIILHSREGMENTRKILQWEEGIAP